MWNWKQKLALLAVPAVLAIGGSVILANAASPSAGTSPTSSQTAAGETATESPEITSATVDPNEPSLPGGGHSDQGDQADHQFDGTE